MGTADNGTDPFSKHIVRTVNNGVYARALGPNKRGTTCLGLCNRSPEEP